MQTNFRLKQEVVAADQESSKSSENEEEYESQNCQIIQVQQWFTTTPPGSQEFTEHLSTAPVNFFIMDNFSKYDIFIQTY